MDDIEFGMNRRPVAIADLHAFVLDDLEAIHAALYSRLSSERPDLVRHWRAETFPRVFAAVVEHLPNPAPSVKMHNVLVAQDYGCADIGPAMRSPLREALLETVRQVLCWDANDLLIARCASAFDATFSLLDELKPAPFIPSVPAHR